MTVHDRNEIASLAAEAGAGNPEAYAALYRRTVSFLRSICARYFQNAHDIDDALQETYVRIFRGLSSLEAPDAFLSWSRTVAQNTCLNILRSHNMLQAREVLTGLGTEERETGLDDIPAAEYRKEWNPEAAAENQMTAGILLDILNSLTDGQRSCILLWAEGYTYQAIAQKIGLPLGTVRSTIHYTRKKITGIILKMEKEQHIRLHGMAPIPYFLWLLAQQDGMGAGTSPASLADSSPIPGQADLAGFSAVMLRLEGSASAASPVAGAALSASGRAGKRSPGAVLAAGILLTALLFPAARVLLSDPSTRYVPYDSSVTDASVRSFRTSGMTAGSKKSLSGPNTGFSTGSGKSGRLQPGSTAAGAEITVHRGGTGAGGHTTGLADFHFERHTDTAVHPEKMPGAILHQEADDIGSHFADAHDPGTESHQTISLSASKIRSEEQPAEPAPDAAPGVSAPPDRQDNQPAGLNPESLPDSFPETETETKSEIYAADDIQAQENTPGEGEISSGTYMEEDPDRADQTTAVRETPVPGRAAENMGDSEDRTAVPESIPEENDGTAAAAEPVPAAEPEPEPEEPPVPEPEAEPVFEPEAEPVSEPGNEQVPEDIPIQWFQFLNAPYEIMALEAYEPMQLLYEVYPPDATEKIQWNTTRDDITVDENGVILFQPEYLEEGGFGMAGVTATISGSTITGGPWFKLTYNSSTDTSGVCGDNVYWYIDGNTLVIYGSGPMYDFNTRGPEWGVPTQQVPWVRYIDQITAVEIQEGVTVIGSLAFELLEKITGAVVIPEGVECMEGWAFSLTNVSAFYLPRSLQTLYAGALVCRYPPDVIYAGTEEEWNMIAIEDPESFYTTINSLTFSG